MKIYNKINNDVWEDTFEDANGIISPNQIKIDNKNILIFCFIDVNENHRIIFENINRTFVPDPNLDTISVENTKYSIGTDCERMYLDLSCKLEGFKQYFIHFLNDILEHITLDFSLIDSYEKVCQEWRAFLYKKTTKLTLEEQYGLISEIYFLILLFEIRGPIESLKAWRGPYREIDFKFTNIDFEIKSTLKNKHEHIINGLEQLLPKKDKLGLISFCLNKSDSDTGFSLPDFVEKAEKFLENYPSLLLDFRRLLNAELNYDITDIDSYNNNRFEFIEINYYHIDSSFPSLTKNNLRADLPKNISKIEYTLDFTNLSFTVFDKTLLENLII
jgi:hypothetical protein